jgi:hypothetical protein
MSRVVDWFCLFDSFFLLVEDLFGNHCLLQQANDVVVQHLAERVGCHYG